MGEQRFLRFGPFRFDGRLLERTATSPTWMRVHITERQARVLGALLDRYPRFVPRNELIAIAFGPHGTREQLDTAIAELRGALDDRIERRGKDVRHAYIDTVFGDGFVFRHAVRVESAFSDIVMDDYRTGMRRWNDREPAALRDAVVCFDRALQRAPSFGAAYAAQADCYAILGSYGWTSARDAAIRARAAAQQALALESELAQPHATFGFLSSLFEHQWAAALPAFQESIRRASSYGTARHWYALLLAAVDDPVQALEQIGIAREIDPLSRIIDVHAGAILYWARLFDEAEEHCLRAITYNPSFWYPHYQLGLVYDAQGKLNDALAKQIDATRCYAPSSSPLLEATLIRAHVRCGGSRAEARRKLDALRAKTMRGAGAFHTATAYAAIGDTDAAFECLERARAASDVWVSFLEVDARLDALRPAKRFRALRGQLGLNVSQRRSPGQLRGTRLTAALHRLDL